MREIKFRAWDEGNKVMHHDFQFVRTGTEGNDWILFVSDKQPIGGEVQWSEDPYFAQQLKIMQFTGLCDKGGKEIYEGDILRLGYPCRSLMCADADHYHDKIVNITFQGGAFWFTGQGVTDCNWHHYNAKDREIIGNVHENPELSQTS